MPFIYITGAAATGKSELAKVLGERGFAAFDEDAPAVGSAHEKANNTPVSIPPVSERNPEWFLNHEWKVLDAVMKKLKSRAKTETIILLGNSINAKAAAEIFDVIFYLHVDKETLKQRIMERSDNDFGKSDSEMKLIFQRQAEMDKDYGALSGSKQMKIDAGRPMQTVVDKIVRNL